MRGRWDSAIRSTAYLEAVAAKSAMVVERAVGEEERREVWKAVFHECEEAVEVKLEVKFALGLKALLAVAAVL